jgi:hypothetical protein
LYPGVPAETVPAIAIERARPKPAKRVDFFMFISCFQDLGRKFGSVANTTKPGEWR